MGVEAFAYTFLHTNSSMLDITIVTPMEEYVFNVRSSNGVLKMFLFDKSLNRVKPTEKVFDNITTTIKTSKYWSDMDFAVFGALNPLTQGIRKSMYRDIYFNEFKQLFLADNAPRIVLHDIEVLNMSRMLRKSMGALISSEWDGMSYLDYRVSI